MAQKLDYTIPYNTLIQYVPQNLRNPVIKGLIDNLFDRFLTKDESIPLYGYVGRKPSSTDDQTIKISQPTPERDINAIVPVLSFKQGSTTHAFTVADLVNKARVIGVSPSGAQEWLYSQSNNFLPPIDIDRFANFYNYFWIAKAIPATPSLAWNPENLPEYYTIAKPKPTDLNKLNVEVATTEPINLTGTGFADQSFDLEFTSPTTFTLTATVGLGAFGPQVQTYELTSNNQHIAFDVTDGSSTVRLVEFDVVREDVYNSENEVIGSQDFAAGDRYSLDTTFLSRNYVLTPVSLSPSATSKGIIRNVSALSTYQTIDGVQVSEGQRVLVLKNGDDNGIYEVRPQGWVRAADYVGSTAVAGARVWVKSGLTNGGKLFTAGEDNSWPAGVVADSNTTDWQEGNFWVHSSELSSYNLTRSDVTQAVRPIIEFSADLQLNSMVQNGVPTAGNTGSLFRQEKTEFNQLPFFDLFRYDGTHANLVSAVFYYEEDLTAELDTDLQKRVKNSGADSSDYLFNHGCMDANGELLFYKLGDKLESIWHAGYTQATIIDQVFIPALDPVPGEVKGTLTNLVPTDFTQQQVWTLTALSATTFSVSGSKTKTLPVPYNTLTVGTAYSNVDFSCLIEAGTSEFVAGDTFVFRVGALETPRYVYRDESEQIFDLYGGRIADEAGVGAYQVPRTFINNPYNSSRDEISEGTLYSHFRSILQNQPATSAPDYAFGGMIKNWSEQHTLLASLLMQKDLTPISMIDLAQRQYETGLNSVADIFQTSIADYFATFGVVAVDGSADQEEKLNKLLDYILTIRASDNDVRTVLYDTTAAVPGFPITLPALGILSLVQPTIQYDNAIGQDLLVHHDGHNSTLYIDDVMFRRQVLNNSADTTVIRSDGSETPAVGSFTATPPQNPYKGELWIRPNGADSEMYAFDVDFDVTPTGTPVIGQKWYDRSSRKLSIYNGTLWAEQPSPAAAWKRVNLADTLNQLLLLVETRLYNGINLNARKVDFNGLMGSPEFQELMKRELFAYASSKGLAPLGSDYLPNNAFTWNYSQGAIENFPPLATDSVPARWLNVLKAHQATVPGVIPTERPNLEPWKLLGFSTFSSWWATLTSQQQADFTPFAQPHDVQAADFNFVGTIRAVKTSFSATLPNGLQTIDGVSLVAGDTVLLQNEVGPENNGLWVVSAGNWTRSSASIAAKSYVIVSEGVVNANTVWASTQTVSSIGVDPISFKQVRLWTDALWSHVQSHRPTLRLGVDTTRDRLLPPYVNSTLVQSANALTTVVPPATSAEYEFLDSGPVETVWLSTIDFGYSLARSLFRHDPMLFLGFCWGFNWVEVNGILFDGYDINTPGHKRFRLHGDLVKSVDRSASITVTGTTAEPLSIVYDAYEVAADNRYQNFSVRTADGVALGYVREGQTTSVAGLTIHIEDGGRPFHIGDKFSVDPSGIVGFVANPRYSYLGFGQIFTNALRSLSIDTTDSYAVDAYRGWDVNMGWRAGGLVATDDLKVRTDTDTLSESSYNLLFKKNEIATDMWLQGLRVTVTQFGGYRETEAGKTALGGGQDWVFRIEGYNPRFLDISYYQMTTAHSAVTFQALSGDRTELIWLEPTQIVGTVKTQLPITITGIQNVVTFLFGYKKYLEDQGWEFNRIGEDNNIDHETGRARTWQLEIEKFIDRCYRGIDVGQGHIVNPFMDQVWIRQNTGLLAAFRDSALFDITGNAGVFDITGVKLNSADIFTTRGNQASGISALAPMYSVHVQLDEYEHLFVFNNFVENSTRNGILYDPFSGGRVVTYKFNGRRQAAATFRPEFGGHYLVGSEVRQNLQASTDNIANFYDPNKAFENVTTTRHALALLGFSNKDYFNDLDISDKSQFNFWRGLIQAKGTNMSIDAYLNNNRFKEAKIDEYWAYKVAEYGDARQRSFPELKLYVDDTLQQFTQLQFDAPEGSALANFTQINRFDENRWFSIDDIDQDAYFKAEQIGSYDAAVVEGQIIALPFIADQLAISGTAAVEKLNSTSLRVTAAGRLVVVGYGPATPRYNPIKLFNYVENELIEEIPLWHPAMGQHTPTALSGINIISSLNPAKYNVSTQVVNNNSYDPLRPWGSNEVGRVWFDTRNLAYVPYWDEVIFPNRAERLSRWGALSDFATVDVYEWVQSSVPPSEYNALALAQAGDADLDPATKAAGVVAGKETYVRDRLWAARPIAWSYSPVPVEAAHPSFLTSGGVFDAKLDLSGGLAVLSSGTFAGYGIEAGMRIGAFDNNEIDPKPLSEAIVTTEFTKKIYIDDAPETLVSVDGFNVQIDVVGYAEDLSGPVAFVATPSSTVRRMDINGTAIDEWDVETVLTVSEVGGDLVETVVITEALGLDGPKPFVAANPGQPYIRAEAAIPFRPANPGQPYIAHVEGQEFRPARDEQPYLAPVQGQPFIPATTGQSGYQIIRFNREKTMADATGLANDARIYRSTVSFDGAAPIVLSVVGSAAQSFAQLLESLNSQVPHRPFTLSQVGDIIVNSGTTGAASSVLVADISFVNDMETPATTDDVTTTGIFSSLTNFDSIEVAAPGINGDPGQPYIADFAGQPFMEADPGQPYIAHVEGQEFIPADPGQEFVPEVVGQEFIPATPGQAATSGAYLAGAQVTLVAGIPMTFDVTSFGFKITVTPTESGTFPADVVRNAIVAALGSQVTVRDAVVVDTIVSVPEFVPNVSALSNDPEDQTTAEPMYGWAAWRIPTQEQLSADGKQPNSSWKPYLGDAVAQPAFSNQQMIEAIAESEKPLMLNNGTAVNRYETSWADWRLLENTVVSKTQTTSGPLVLESDANIDETAVSVYVNGIAQLKANFAVLGKTLTISSVRAGSNAVMIIRKYEPSVEELGFDPAVEDDLTFQQQYKQDYEYVEQLVRDSEGSYAKPVYYFWVRDKTTIAQGKSLSVQAMAQELRDGPATFLTFQNILSAANGLPRRYDAVAISGLSYLVGKDDAYKLRFTRNFTLRDDPQDLELKDVHTEWSLIRPNQRTRIPEKLWNKLTDSVAGQDLAGSAVPALRRVLYDERNGTATQFGFEPEQTLAPKDLLVSTITYTIVNTKLVDTTLPVPGPDFISFLDPAESESWFATPQAARQTMTDIWTSAKPAQINEIFFAALNDMLANNYQLSDIFKTSRLSAYSIKVVATATAEPAYE